jgi:hypothetical protein
MNNKMVIGGTILMLAAMSSLESGQRNEQPEFAI